MNFVEMQNRKVMVLLIPLYIIQALVCASEYRFVPIFANRARLHTKLTL